jgi:hypothetical protein
MKKIDNEEEHEVYDKNSRLIFLWVSLSLGD